MSEMYTAIFPEGTIVDKPPVCPTGVSRVTTPDGAEYYLIDEWITKWNVDDETGNVKKAR